MERAETILPGSGRERELEAVFGEFGAVSGGVTRRVVVTGPLGIGKSWLLNAVHRGFAARGVAVAGAKGGRGATSAFGVARDLAASLLEIARVRASGPREFEAVSDRLRCLLGDVEAERYDDPEARLAARLRRVEALAELFSVAGRRGAVVLLDDLETADAGSRDLLAAVFAGLSTPGAGSGLLLVASWQEPPAGELAHRFQALPGIEVELASLDVDGVRSFLAGARLAERLLERTEGIPSRLEEMLLPRPADLAGRRLARLHPLSRRIALAAALLGRPTSASFLRDVAGAEASQAHLDELVEGRFLSLRLTSGQPVYELIREVDRSRLLDGADFAERRELHVAIASKLEAIDGDVEEIARHWLAGDPAGRGARWALRAAEELARRHAYDAAAEFFREAIAHDGRDRAPALHLRLSEVLEASGDSIGALRHLGLGRRGADAASARTIRARAARICAAIGKTSQALRLATSVLGGTRVPAAGDAAGATAYAVVCDVRFLQGRYDEAIAACTGGIERKGLDAHTRILLRNTLGKALLNQGSYEEASRVFAENVAEADAVGLVREQVRALINEGVVAHRTGDRRRAFERYREAHAAASDPLLGASATGNLGALHHEVGDFELATDLYGRAIASFVRAGRRKEASHHSLNLARMMHFLGDLDAAAAHAAFARREAAAVGDPYLVGQADLVAGEVLADRREPYRAEAVLHVARETFETIGNPLYLAETELALAHVYLSRGEVEVARDELLCARQAANPESDALGVELDLLEAELALHGGDLARARQLLEGAKRRLLSREHGVGGSSDLSAPWRTHALLSRLRRAEGDEGGAEADRLRALRLIEDLAARVPAAKRPAFLDHALRSLGDAREAELTPAFADRVRQLDRGASAVTSLAGESSAIRRIRLALGPIARSMAPVVIRGESGTGKESLADAIHRSSLRRDKPYVKVLAGASAEEELFASLFGVAGDQGRTGALAQAAGGTVFVDELGPLSPAGQIMLARLLGQKEYRPVGSDEILRADVRLLVSTSSDLEAMLASRLLRRDLYDELEAVTIELPPLRERIEDVPDLAQLFLDRICAERALPPKRFSSDALELLQAWIWPGNVRELENVVSAVSIFAEGEEVGAAAFQAYGRFPPPRAEAPAAPAQTPERVAPAAPAAELPATLDFYAMARERGLGLRELREEIEHQMIASALRESGGNISEAARLLQMKRSRLSQIVNAEPKLRSLTRAAS
ncbi:MAG TPA: sigma 54-interacting transcriptional regulator [Vulgatibacter sp.]|nr:sigma 54-interacting transcriptional regulator [Vulgatibacter sp.]